VEDVESLVRHVSHQVRKQHPFEETHCVGEDGDLNHMKEFETLYYFLKVSYNF